MQTKESTIAEDLLDRVLSDRIGLAQLVASFIGGAPNNQLGDELDELLKNHVADMCSELLSEVGQ